MSTELEPTTTTETENPEPRKPGAWTNVAGPRKSKDCVRILERVHRLFDTFVELTGVIGKPDTEHRCVLSRFTIGGRRGYENPAAVSAWNTMGDRYQWRLTNDNLATVYNEAESLHRMLLATLPVHDQRHSLEEEAETTRLSEERIQEHQREDAERERILESLKARQPAGAMALIVAYLDEDKSDLMSDYINSHEVREVAIGWRYGNREDFKQLRAAAATFPETMHLAQDGTVADAEIEHRENWSMSSGNYLKQGHRHSNGWRVKSIPLDKFYIHPSMEIALPAVPTITPIATASSAAGVTMSWNVEKKGIEIRFPEKPDLTILASLKAHGFRWARNSRCWYIRESPEALAFAQTLISQV